MLYLLAVALLLLKLQREANLQGRTFCQGYFMRVGYHLICKRYIAYSLSNKQSQECEDSLASGKPRKVPTGQSLQ
jgi:hypothetical protein